jgi:hypothetical protein
MRSQRSKDVGVAQNSLEPKTANKQPDSLRSEAQQIADEITTIQQLRGLEKRLETAHDRLSSAQTERAYENASRKQEVLDLAVEIASAKTYQWQFIPTLDLDTPLSWLKHAYKVYSEEEKATLQHELSSEPYNWYAIDGYGEKEDPEPYLKQLIQFRKIVESDTEKQGKVQAINALVSKSKGLRDEFFDTDGKLSPGDQWFADELRQAGLPIAVQLYSEGFDTPEKCLKIDPATFSSRKGVGPKKVEQLKVFQDKTRRKLDK